PALLLSRVPPPLPPFFFFHCSGAHRDLHSFPTRRSSDLSSVTATASLCSNSPRSSSAAVAEEGLQVRSSAGPRRHWAGGRGWPAARWWRHSALSASPSVR